MLLRRVRGRRDDEEGRERTRRCERSPTERRCAGIRVDERRGVSRVAGCLASRGVSRRGVSTHRARSAHPHVVRHLRDLVRRTVRHVRARGRSTVRAENHAALVLARHDGRLRSTRRSGAGEGGSVSVRDVFESRVTGRAVDGIPRASRAGTSRTPVEISSISSGATPREGGMPYAAMLVLQGGRERSGFCGTGRAHVNTTPAVWVCENRQPRSAPAST